MTKGLAAARVGPASAMRSTNVLTAYVLQEFVGSNYASQVCSRCNLQPTDYGVISGM